MRIDAEMNLMQLAELVGIGCGPTRARLMRELLIDAGWSDTDQLPPELWSVYVEMAETAIALGLAWQVWEPTQGAC